MRRTAFSPLRELVAMQNDLSRLFGDFFRDATGQSDETPSGQWHPPMDVSETPDAFVIRAEIPGVEKDQLELSVENGVFTVRGERQREAQQEGESYVRVERATGPFKRSISLPPSADPEQVAARYRDGVLEVRIGKQEQSKPRRIAVEG